MRTFLIEREVPGASKLTYDELLGITRKSNDTVDSLERPYEWRTATSPATRSTACTTRRTRRRASMRGGGFPANSVERDHGGVRPQRPT